MESRVKIVGSKFQTLDLLHTWVSMRVLANDSIKWASRTDYKIERNPRCLMKNGCLKSVVAL